MGFNIGRFIGQIAPFVGAALGGPIGGALGLGVSSALADDTRPAATVGRVTQPGPVSAPFSPLQFQGFPGPATSIGPGFQTAAFRLPPGLGPIIGGGAAGAIPSFFGGGNGNGKSPISMILAKARAATGGPVTRNKIIDAAKVCGLEVAAQTFGLEVREVCLVVVKGRTRRRRGVSAADVRRTKRTIGFASKIRKDLKALAK